MSWSVHGTKKGDLPLVVEKRKHHKVTVLRNVSGDAGALLKALQDSLGAGGSSQAGGAVVELQGDHVTRCAAFLVARRARLTGVRSALLPAVAPAVRPVDGDDGDGDDDDDGRAPRRKPRWTASQKEAAKPPGPERATTAAPGWAKRAHLAGKCPLDYEFCSFRDACGMFRFCTCDTSALAWLDEADDDDDGKAPPFYEERAARAGPAAGLGDLCEAFRCSDVAGAREPALKEPKAKKATVLAARAEKRATERDLRAARAAPPREPPRRAPDARRPGWRPAGKRSGAWDADDVAWGLGRGGDNDDGYDFSAGAYADADGVDDRAGKG